MEETSKANINLAWPKAELDNKKRKKNKQKTNKSLVNKRSDQTAQRLHLLYQCHIFKSVRCVSQNVEQRNGFNQLQMQMAGNRGPDMKKPTWFNDGDTEEAKMGGSTGQVKVL